MGYLYVDETIQERGQFIIGAVIYSETDLTPPVFEAIQSVGLKPGIDEFKSCFRMSECPEQVQLRDKLKELIRTIRIGVVIVSSESRKELGKNALKGVLKFVSANNLQEVESKIFVDSEIRFSKADIQSFLKKTKGKISVLDKQNSKHIGGIQVADLVAHSLGIMLMETLGLITKKVRAGENSGYDPDMQIELGFELWTTLRYSFFHSPQAKAPFPTEDHFSYSELIAAQTCNVQEFGLFFPSSCPQSLKDAATERFGEVYLGCIH